MATLQQIRDKADTKLVQFWQLLTQKQNAYYAKHNKYFQLLVSGGREVQSDEEHDFTLNHPSDEAHAIDVDFPWTDKLPFEIRVDEWVGPDGNGYRAQVWVDYQGTTYSRHRDSNQNDSGWFEYQEVTV